ncbi:MAG TPA: HAD-IIA family hydrolase [Anaerolineae bacterium]|nr:HAD-IIA family hydrolase [Anaerolineae bacterium]HMR65863.1 HAD-IIA family hydrolase [Anaerolineae bacterium]
MNFDDIKALIIDMDGVLWRGDLPLPGLHEFFEVLTRRAMPFMLATNNASKTVAQYQQKFAKFGIEMPGKHVMTSSLAAAAYLQDELEPGSRVYVVGEDGLRQAMLEAGFEVAEDDSRPVAAVVGGIDFTLTYQKLKHATMLIHRGARFVGSNGDLTLPSEEGFYPGAGSILAAITAATGVHPTIVGKPEPLMFQIALRQMGTQPTETAMIGDRLETDVLGGQRAGLKTILVETGVDNEQTVAQKGIRPDLVVRGIDQLVEMWL